MKKLLSGPFLYILIILAIILLTSSMDVLKTTKEKNLTYTEVMEQVRDGKIEKIHFIGNTAYFLFKDSSVPADRFPDQYDKSAYIPSLSQFNSDLAVVLKTESPTALSIATTYEPTPSPGFLATYWPAILMLLIIVGIYIFMMRQAQSGGTKAMNFGKSKVKMTMGENTNKTFADVAGADEEKEEMSEIVEFLRNPDRFTKLGARIPKGVLLVGPPGGGKTLLAKAVAGEARVPFFSISGSDFVEMFVGVGASRVRDLFDNAKKNAPSIVFIDEIDAVGRQRGTGMGGGHDEREQTLNQLLVEMDGFAVNQGVVVIAATNRVDILDPALLRAGRFDRQIFVNYPDVKGREEILKVHAKGKPLAKDVDLKTIAKRTVGFIGADLENTLNEAAIFAARRNKAEIGMQEIEEAITRVIAGPEKKSRVVTEKDKKCTAYHEVGHAICAQVLPECDPVHEISIIARGMAAGYTLTLPVKDDAHVFRKKLLEEIVMMLGGRAAEALVLGDISTGASNDIERATELARNMVVKYGMSDDLGPIFYGSKDEFFLGKELGHSNACSEAVAAKIDAEVQRIIREAFDQAKAILQENMDALHRIAHVLMEQEKLDGDAFLALFENKQESNDEFAQPPAEQPAKETAAPAPPETPDAPAPGGETH